MIFKYLSELGPFGIIIGLAFIYLCTCLGYWLFHRFFVFIPSRALSTRPDALGLEYREIFFESMDKVRIQGWLIKGKGSNGNSNNRGMVVLFCPGMKGTMSKFLTGNIYLANAGFDVFMFSYRGFGKSGMRWPTEKGVYRDTESAYKYLKENLTYPEEKILIFGQSIGCAPAARTASLNNPGGLMLEGAFPSVPDVAARAVPWLPVRLITTARFDLKLHLKKVDCPLLIIHSSEDEVIPLSDAEKIFQYFSGSKEKVIIKGKHTLGLEVQPGYFIEKLTGFLSSHT